MAVDVGRGVGLAAGVGTAAADVETASADCAGAVVVWEEQATKVVRTSRTNAKTALRQKGKPQGASAFTRHTEYLRMARGTLRDSTGSGFPSSRERRDSPETECVCPGGRPTFTRFPRQRV